MKKIVILIVCLSALISCKKEGEIIKGEFVFYEDAAVLQTDSLIYGVIINKKTKDLDKQSKAYKSNPTDMVEVEIRGKVTNQKDDKILWENKVEIVEILSVKASSKGDNNVVKLGNE